MYLNQCVRQFLNQHIYNVIQIKQLVYDKNERQDALKSGDVPTKTGFGARGMPVYTKTGFGARGKPVYTRTDFGAWYEPVYTKTDSELGAGLCTLGLVSELGTSLCTLVKLLS